MMKLKQWVIGSLVALGLLAAPARAAADMNGAAIAAALMVQQVLVNPCGGSDVCFGTGNAKDAYIVTDGAKRIKVNFLGTQIDPMSDAAISLGTSTRRFKDAVFSGTITAGAFSGPGSFTFINVDHGTVTANTQPTIDATVTWNSGATTFTGFKFDVTDTASASASILSDWQVGGGTKWRVYKNGEAFARLATNVNIGFTTVSSVATVQAENDARNALIAMRLRASSISFQGGNVLFVDDNTDDIGTSSATRPRTGYFGTSVSSPLFSSTTTGLRSAVVYGTSDGGMGVATGLFFSSGFCTGIVGNGVTGFASCGSDPEVRIGSGHSFGWTGNANADAASLDTRFSRSAAGYVKTPNLTIDGTVLSRKATVTTDATVGARTYTAAELLGGLILRDTAGGDRSDVSPTAALLVAAMPGAVVGQSFEFTIRNTAGAAETITLTAGVGVTLSGTMTIAQNNTKRFLVVFTNVTAASEAVTIYSLGTFVHVP